MDNFPVPLPSSPSGAEQGMVLPGVPLKGAFGGNDLEDPRSEGLK